MIADLCICGHETTAHDYTGDEFDPSWGVCDSRTCPCDGFEHVGSTDETFVERLGVAS